MFTRSDPFHLLTPGCTHAWLGTLWAGQREQYYCKINKMKVKVRIRINRKGMWKVDNNQFQPVLLSEDGIYAWVARNLLPQGNNSKRKEEKGKSFQSFSLKTDILGQCCSLK